MNTKKASLVEDFLNSADTSCLKATLILRPLHPRTELLVIEIYQQGILSRRHIRKCIAHLVPIKHLQSYPFTLLLYSTCFITSNCYATIFTEYLKTTGRIMPDKSDYTIGWVCAIQTELVAAIEHLDEEHDFNDYEAAPNDNNTYVFGSVGKHNIVIAALPTGEYGISSAAGVARDMIRSFTNIRIGLMVGIGGGAPLMDPEGKQKQDIRLGDVVISTPYNGKGGVLQYDYGEAMQGQGLKHWGHLNSPPQSLLAAVTVLGAEFQRKGNALDEDVTILLEKNKKIRRIYQRPDQTTDRLYRSSFIHPDGEESCSKNCNEPKHIIQRKPRDENEDTVVVHMGLIASANQLMKDAPKRDELARTLGALCFEMEAAGLMNQLPFFVVRGICDYSDTHMNKEWQGYAAMTAAAYARKLLLKLVASKVVGEIKLSELKEQLQERRVAGLLTM